MRNRLNYVNWRQLFIGWDGISINWSLTWTCLIIMSSSIILLLPPHLPSNCIWLNKYMFSIWQRNTFLSYRVTLYQSDIFLTGLSEKYGINYYAIQGQKPESNKSISNEQYKIVFMESEMKLTLVIFSPKDLRHTSVSKMIWSNRAKSREELLLFLMPKEKKDL